VSVVVTITPDGQPLTVEVDGHDISGAMRAESGYLTIPPGRSPLLSVTMTVDEIVVKAPGETGAM
jgi:hypothetical protein